eukprot:9489045-Pyramimonas_sp.AAC.1
MGRKAVVQILVMLSLMKYWLCKSSVTGSGEWADAPTNPAATFPATVNNNMCTNAMMLKADV